MLFSVFKFYILTRLENVYLQVCCWTLQPQHWYKVFQILSRCSNFITHGGYSKVSISISTSIRQEGDSSRRRTANITAWTLLTSAAWDLTPPLLTDPRPAEFIVVSEGWRWAPLVGRNDSSTCCGRNVTVQSGVPSWDSRNSPLKFPLVFKCMQML